MFAEAGLAAAVSPIPFHFTHCFQSDRTAMIYQPQHGLGAGKLLTHSEELPMTMQVAMVGTDGIVLAGDTKWVTHVETEHGPRRHVEYRNKITISKYVAISCAGDMDCATEFASLLLGQWHEGGGVHRIREILGAPRKVEAECIVAIASPSPSLIRILNFQVREGDEVEWRLMVRPVTQIQVAGDQANDARYWQRFYTPTLPTCALMNLAALLVVEARKFNNAMIGGLEMVYSDASGFHRASDEDCRLMETKVKSRAIEIGEIATGARSISGSHAHPA